MRHRSGTSQRGFQGSSATGRRAAMIAIVMLATAACRSASTSTPHFTGDAVLVQFASEGGFIAPVAVDQRVPTVTVLGDGTVVTPAAVPAIYPGPAVAPLVQAHISAAQITKLLVDARRLGLRGRPLDFGHPTISDMPTTKLSIGDGTRIVAVQSAYALGEGSPDSGLTAPQRAARRALQSFIDELGRLPSGDRAFVPRAVAVFTLERGTASPTPTEPSLSWPIRTRPTVAVTDISSCVVVTGSEVATLLGTLARANENTRWQVGDHTLALAFRPLAAPAAGCTL
jgi:hypothetical protein